MRTAIKILSFACALTMALCAAGCANGTAKDAKTYREQYEKEEVVKTEDMLFDATALANAPVEYYETANVVPDGHYDVKGIKYTGVDFLGAQTKIFAYLGFPSTPMPEGGYPAMVLVHGGGGVAYWNWVEQWTNVGYAAIAMDLNGYMANPATEGGGAHIPNSEGGPTGYIKKSEINGKFEDSWLYFSVASCMRAHSLLAADERVNANKIGLTGISWGGILGLIVAGVDHRFAMFNNIYGTGWIHEKSNEQLAAPEVYDRFMKYYDPSAYAPYIVCPTLHVGGNYGVGSESSFTMWQRKRTCDLIPAKQFYSLRHDMDHDYNAAWGATECIQFANHILKNDNKILRANVVCHNGEAVVTVLPSEHAVARMQLVYTADTPEIPSTEWKWNRRILQGSAGKTEVKFTLPQDATVWFVEVEDDYDYKYSTELQSQII